MHTIINHCSLYHELLWSGPGRVSSCQSSDALMMRRDTCSQTSAAHHCALLEMRAPVWWASACLRSHSHTQHTRVSPSSGCLSHQHYTVSTFHRILDNIVFTVRVHSRNNVIWYESQLYLFSKWYYDLDSPVSHSPVIFQISLSLCSLLSLIVCPEMKICY